MTDIPLNPEDVTKEWLKKTLEFSMKQNVKVLDLIPLKTAGYLSTACKASIQLDNEKIENIFLKITLPNNDPFMAFINRYNVDTTEVIAYSEVLPQLIDFEKSYLKESRLEQAIPKFYAGGSNKSNQGFFLILEDLSENFTMFDNGKGLDIKYVNWSMEEIAHYHAVSYAYGVKNGVKWNEKYPAIFPRFMEDQGLLDSVEANLKLFEKDLEENEAPKDLIEKLSSFAKRYISIIPKYIKVDESRFLIHGDYWSNNVMFGKESKLAFIMKYFCSKMMK